MSGRSISRTSRFARARRLLFVAGVLGAGALTAVVAQATTQPAFDARASLAPAVYYINDSYGSAYDFTVQNTGTSYGIGGVEITRPSGAWTITQCTSPYGWSAQMSATKCRFRSSASQFGIEPRGDAKDFKVIARTAAGNVNVVGTWPVLVSRSNRFDTPSTMKYAPPTGAGLSTTLHVYQLHTAVVSDTPLVPGAPCPPANKSAIVGSTKTIVVCGRNRANVALQPTAGHSSLTGTFIKTTGAFSSGVIRSNSGNVVLAQWVDTVVTDVFGPHKKVVTQVGSASNRTSPLRTFPGYDATSSPPVAVGDVGSTDEDTPLVVAAPGVLGNDDDEEDDPLTAVDVTQPANGTVALNADGSYTYTPNANFHGTDTFTYKADDGYTKSPAATVTITVTGVNDVPVAVDDAQDVGEDAAAVTVGVLGNDTDVDTSDTLTVDSIDTTGTKGTVAVAAGGTHVTYDPNGKFENLGDGQTATDTFTYTLSDGNGGTDTATVTITIVGDNDAPDAVNDAYGTDEDTQIGPLAVLGNDTDAEGAVTLTSVSATSNGGTVADNGDGTVTFNPGSSFQNLAAGETRATTFTYTITDAQNATDTATVTVTVTGVNDVPVAVDDAQDVGEDAAAATVDVLGDDTDADASDTLTVDSIDTTGTKGTVAVAAGGTHVTYDPNGKFENLGDGQTATDTFTYTLSDGNGGTDTATVTITIVGDNDAPDAVNDAYGTDEDTQIGPLAVLANDTDAEGPVTITNVSATSNGGTVTNNGDGTVTFNPGSSFQNLAAGQTRDTTFTYTITDAQNATDTATVTVTVTGINDAPIGNDDAQNAGEDAAAATVNVLGNDTDAEGQTLSVTAIDATGTVGTATLSGGVVTYDPNGKFENLGDGQTATDTFTYTVSDGAGGTDAATVTITIVGDNDDPNAVNDAYATDEATQIGPLTVLANDTDAEGAVTITNVSATSNGGTVTNNNDGTVTFNPAGAFEDLAAGQTRQTTFTYTVTDAQNATDTATVTVTVSGINDAPVGVDDAANVGEDSTGTVVSVLGNDTDAESQTLTVSALSAASSGSVTNNGTHVTYTPAAAHQNLAAGETAQATFTYTVTDSQGGSDSGVTVTITIVGANDAPAGVNDAYQVVEDTPLVVAAPGVLGNDSDADTSDTLTAGGATTPAHGAVDLNEDGSFTYTPAEGYTGPDSFDYTVSDGKGGSDTGTVHLTVVPPNAAPAAVATDASGNEDGGPIVVSLTGTDADGDALTFDVGTATNGLVTEPDPNAIVCGATLNTCTVTVTYTPSPNFNGSDSFTYTVNDGTVDSAPATASITVDAVNDEPSFTKGANQTVNEDAGAQTATGWATAISAGPANEAGQTVSFVATNTNNDLFSVQPAVASDGTLTYTTAANANGVATVTVHVTDNGGTANGGDDASPTQQFTITVGAVNDAPSFTKGADQTVNEDAGAQSVSNWASAISKGPADESAQTVSFTTSNDNNALFSVQPGVTPTGTLVFTPAPNAVGSATVTISLSDTGGTANGGDDTSDSQTFAITVNPVNDAPSFTTAGNQAVLEDAGAQTVNGFVTNSSAGPSDEAAQTVTVAVVSNDSNGLFSAQPSITNGTLTYTPATNANGVATVTVQASDDGGTANGGADTSPTQTFTITVTAVNDTPSFTKGGDQTLNEDAGAQSVSNWATAISKGPADESAQTLTFLVTNDNNDLFMTQPAVSPTGTLTYTSAANKYGTATVSVALKDNGGVANGGDDTSDVQTFTITVNAVNDAPVAAAKSYTVQTNMKITLSGLLTGATDPNDVAGDAAWSPSFTVGSITAGAGCVGCTISNILPNGTFDFEPPAGQTGAFTVTYTVVDDGHPAPGVASAAQTITFNVSGDVIWFADSVNGADGAGRGTLSRPFKTLAAVAAVDTTNHKVFLSPGTYTDAYTAQAGSLVAGSGAKAASFDALYGVTPPAGTAARPAVNGTNPTITQTLTLGSNNTVRGLTLTGANALTGTSFGTLVTGNNATSTTDVVLNSAGQALSLTGGTINGDFVSTDSDGGTDNVHLTNVQTTTSTSLGSGALSGATDDALEIVGQNGTFSYGGTIGNTAATGAVVAIGSKTGGTVTLSGAITDTAGGLGVSLTNNGGATINLTGGVVLSSGAQPAFAATGGGTVSVTGAANTIASTTGTALNIANTTIGAADVTFQQVSANGAASGIVLDNTGSVGNLNVTGTGTTAGSGGTIQNGTGGDLTSNQCAAVSSTAGTGIFMRNTRDVSLRNMNLSNFSNFAVLGYDVTNLTMERFSVTGTNGSNAGQDEDSVHFCNLLGSATISNSTINGGFENSLRVHNTSGTLNRLTVSATTLATRTSSTDADDAFLATAFNTATMNVTLNNVTVTTARGDVFQYSLGDNSTGDLVVQNSAFSNNHPAVLGGGGGVTVGAGSSNTSLSTNFTYSIANNTFRDALGNGLTMFLGNGTSTGTITGNTFGVAGVQRSAGASAIGYTKIKAGGTAKIGITNNTIRGYGADAGIRMLANDGNPTVRATITGNSVTEPSTLAGNSSFAGITIEPGALSTDNVTMCLDLGGAGPLQNSVSTGDPSNFNDVNLALTGNVTVDLPGYTGGTTDSNAVASYLIPRNSGNGAPTVFVGNSFNGTTSYTHVQTNCL